MSHPYSRFQRYRLQCPTCQAALDLARCVPWSLPTVKSILAGEPMIVDCHECKAPFSVVPDLSLKVGEPVKEFAGGESLHARDLQLEPLRAKAQVAEAQVAKFSQDGNSDTVRGWKLVSYIPVRWRGTTKYLSSTDEIGVSFNVQGVPDVLRVRMDAASVRYLLETLGEALSDLCPLG